MNTQITLLQNLLFKHDPLLVRPKADPKENLIFKIWDDGEVTFEKGGLYYSQGTLRSHLQAAFDYQIFEQLRLIFPAVLSTSDRELGYAILTEIQAYQARDLMGRIICRLKESRYCFDFNKLTFSRQKKPLDEYNDDQTSAKRLEARLCWEHSPIAVRLAKTLPSEERPLIEILSS